MHAQGPFTLCNKKDIKSFQYCAKVLSHTFYNIV